jgi:hypothetical protein
MTDAATPAPEPLIALARPWSVALDESMVIVVTAPVPLRRPKVPWAMALPALS